MHDLAEAQTRWLLRDGEFDARDGILRAGERATPLDRSCRNILVLLLQHAGTPVAKERLLEAGWPATIVHENSLAKAIGRLREALGDDADCLKAVYGVGYKLDVAILAPALAAPRPSFGRTGQTELPTMLRRAAIGSLALIGALALVAVGATFHGAASPGVAGDRVRQAQPIIGDAPDSIGKILWVDDHPENNLYEKQFFEKHRIAVHPVTTSEDALKLMAIYDYKAVISDMGRGEDRLAGARFVQQLRARNDRTPVIIYTVRADSPAKQRAQRKLVAESGAQALAVTPEQVRAVVLDVFGNPPERAGD